MLTWIFVLITVLVGVLQLQELLAVLHFNKVLSSDFYFPSNPY